MASHRPAQMQAGLRLVNVWRDVEEPNNVFFTFDVTSVEMAREFIGDPAAAAAGEASGVIDAEYHFLESQQGMPRDVWWAFCLRCESPVLLTRPLSSEARARIAALPGSRRDAMEVMRLISEDTGTSAAIAKSMYLHLARGDGTCHQCAATLPRAELVSCKSCLSLNIPLYSKSPTD